MASTIGNSKHRKKRDRFKKRPLSLIRWGLELDKLIAIRLWIQSVSEGYAFMSTGHDTLFKALADPTRRAIFERLCCKGEQTVTVITAQARVSQPAISKHLSVLKRARLVHDRREGRQIYYYAQISALAALIGWTGQMTGYWQNRFECLEDLVKKID